MSSDQKLISALNKLAQENFSVTDDTILDKLYCHIVNSPILEGETKTTLLPQLGDWLEVIIRGWSNKVLFYGVQVFSVRFIGKIGSDVTGFKMLQNRKVLNFLEHLVSSSDVQNDVCMIVALINTFEIFLKHEEGRKWITESKMWRLVLEVTNGNRHTYTKRAAIKFISQILISSSDYDSTVGKEIMSFVCKPLVSSHVLELRFTEFSSGECTVDTSNNAHSTCVCSICQENKVTMSKDLLYAANYFCDVLENVLLGNNTKLPVKLNVLYREKSDTTCNRSVISDAILDSCSSIQEHKTFTSFIFMVEVSNLLSQNTVSCTTICCCLLGIYSQIHRIIKALILHDLVQVIPDFCATCLYWLSKINKKKTNVNFKCSKCYDMEFTIVLCLRYNIVSDRILPIKIPKFFRGLFYEFHDFNIVVHISKMFKDNYYTNMGQETKKKFQRTQLALSAVTRSYEFIYHHENLIEILEDMETSFFSMVNMFKQNENLTDCTPILLQLLDITSKMLHKYHLKSTAVLNFLFRGDTTIVGATTKLLKYEAKDIRVTILSLQALTKYLKFHILTEVVDDERLLDECIKALQFCNKPVFAEKLKSEQWEVRDTVIELFQSALEMKELMPWFFSKTFPASLLKLIFEKASDDESSYVKASALNFFCKAVKCRSFADVIYPSSLLNLALKTVIDDEMPGVRKAACELIAALYISYVPAVLNDSEEIFETVYLASTKDLDWEVKKSTLKFWRCTIEKELLVEMVSLDCNSPFRQETVLKITRVLGTLGECGCLKAIWLSLNDDCDLKVSQEAQTIVESLENLNEKWCFVDDIVEISEDDKEQGSMRSLSKRLTPISFFRLLKSENWREKIDSRKQWIENTCDSLTSLLDHILAADSRIDDWDHNVVDCY